MTTEELQRVAKEVRDFCHDKFWQKDRISTPPSAGQCGMTSSTLTAVLLEYYPESTWFTATGTFEGERGGGHCWCQDADGNIIDPTADQFGDAEIVFTKAPDSRYRYTNKWGDNAIGWYNEWRRHQEKSAAA